ncbi:iron ABC transporter permease [Deinococcus sp. Leaf326]|uniref:ABC transporter permease n=1 Tax=Deinococcus sp. Leaf326 TaxID=1736338 RepID=UPI0009EB77B3|nr:iron ABC transporter permease [Deinococcus sp. Leaf326]
MDQGGVPITTAVGPSLNPARGVGGVQWGQLLWPLLGLLAFVFLPWLRPSRAFLAGGDSALQTLGASPVLWIPLLTLAGTLALSFLPRRARAWPTLALGLVGFVVTAFFIVSVNKPADLGAVLTSLALLSITGMALSDTGVIKADRFIASATLWVGLFLILFVMFPLFKVLRNAFGESGFSLEAFRSVLSSPAFFVLENTTTPRSETLLVQVLTGIGGVAGLAWSLWKRYALWPLLRTTVLAALGTAVCAAVLFGFGALRNSLLLSVSVATASTALAFAFALLGTRSTAAFGPYLFLPLGLAGYATGSLLSSTPETQGFGLLFKGLGVLAGLGLAWWMTRRRTTAARLLNVFSLLPIITPPFVIGFSLIFLLGRQGLITKGLFGLDTDALLGPLGVGIAQTLAYTPIAYLVLVGVVRSLNGTLEEAAVTLGASRGQVLRTVIWPLVRPGLANAFLLTVIESLADFGNPFVMGGSFLSTEVYFAVEFNPSEASVYGTVLLALSITAFLVQQAWLGRTNFTTVTGKPLQSTLTPLPPVLERALLLVFMVWVLFVGAVYGSMLFGALVKLWGFNNTFTLEHLRNLSTGSMDVFLNTLKIAFISAVPVLMLSVVIAFLITRQKFFGRGFIELGSLLSFAVPGTVIGIGYVLALNSGFGYMTSTMLILVIAFVFRNMPVGIRSAVANLRQIDPSLEEASTTLRASSVTTLWRVVMPLIRPALISAVVFAFVRSMTAISQIIFLISPDHKVVTSEVLSMVERGQLGDAAALSALLVITLAVVITLMNLAVNRWGTNSRGTS